MKKLFFTLLASIVFISIYGQAPQEINYQGVARNSSGTLLSNQNIGIKLDLHQGSAGGTIVFSEAHNKTTNVFGLFTLGIGSVNGSGFIAINWANGPYFLEVSMDPAGGTSYSSVGTQQFMSVPYALYAQTAGNTSATPTITINAPNTVTSAAGSYTINVPSAISYSAGTGIDITGGVISNTASATTPTITGTGATTVTSSGNTFTVNTPVSNVYTAGAGIDITGGVISNTSTAVNSTITSTGIAVVTPTTGNIFNVDVPVPVLSYTAGTNVLSLSQGTTVTTATLNGTGSSTINMVGSGLATVTPTTGSTFTVSVPNPTISIASGSLSISNGNSVAIPSPSLTINSNSLTINGPGGNTVLLPTASTTSLTQGSNVTIVGSAPNYTVSAPAYSISLPGGNTVQITNGVSSSTAAINSTSLTLTGTNNNILSAGGNTVGLNTYTAGTGITISGTAPNYTLASPNQSLSISGNSLSISGANTVTIPVSTVNGLGTGIATVTTSVNNFTVNVPAPTYTASNGVLGFGTNTLDITPTLSLTGTTLTSGAATNSVSLAGLNGIYGGSGSIQTGSTTVTVGTNTLTFLSGATAGKPIANFFGGGITGTSMNLGHIGTNSASLKFIGSATTTPVDYGYVSGSTNGISISGGTSSNGLYATNTAEVGVGTFTTGIGKFVITHTASQANPTMHLRETSGGLNRIKFSNNAVANKFFETAAQTNAVDANGAYSINYFDGTTYKPVLLVTGERKVNINNLNTVLASLHVMENSTTAGGGIASEGFAQSGQLNLIRNNQPVLAARTAVISGDELGKINFAGYDGAAFGDGAKIYAKAAENVTGSNKGTELVFAAVPTGTNTNKDVFKINGANKLEVITSLLIPFNSAAGKVLTSDALGNASWQPVTGTSAAWTSTLGATTLVNTTDKIGIGTNTPFTIIHAKSDISFPYMLLETAVNHGGYISAHSGGTLVAPTYNATDMILGGYGLGGFDVTSFGPSANMYASTSEPWNSTSRGTALYFETTENGQTGMASRMKIDHNGYVGINTNANSSFIPQAILHVETDGSLDKGLRVSNSSSTTNGPSIYLDGQNQDWTITGSNAGNGSGANKFVIRDYSNAADRFVIDNTGKVGVGLTSPESMFHVQNAAGTQIKIGNLNQPTLEWYWDVDGTSNMFLRNEGNGTTQTRMYFDFNSGHLGLGAGSPGYKFTVIGTASDDIATIYAVNNATTTSTASHGIYGLTLNTHSLSAGVYGNNNSVGPSVFAEKNATQTGIAGRFEIKNTVNNADVVFTKTDGGGAAIHAVNGPTVTGGSNVAMWLESGHLKTTGAVPTYTLPLNAATVTGNDIVGTVLLTLSASTTVNQNMVTVFFNKPYSVAPNVMLYSNNANAFNANAFVTGTTTTSFTITFASSVAAATYSFKYLVIE